MASEQFTTRSAPCRGVAHSRTRHQSHFTVVGNHLAQHSELSLLAIGLATHIQSLPDGTDIGIKTLTARFPEGAQRIATALRELESHGYLARVRERLPSGRIVTRTVSYDQPRHRRPASPPTRLHTPARRPTPVKPQPPRPAPRTPPTAAPPPAPEPPVTGHALRAARLLGGLHRADPRLLLSESDVRALAPAAAEWLEREVGAEALRTALVTGLPEPLHHPAALLARRLRDNLPPRPVPREAPAPQTREDAPSADAPLVLRGWTHSCERCERALRTPGTTHCRDCVEDPAA